MSETIQWFPGHMARARRQVQEQLKLVDVVIEVVDARVPISSSNPDLEAITGGKPRVVVLNKADLADPQATAAWIRHLRRQGVEAVALDARGGRGTGEVLAAVARLFAPTLAALQAKGRLPRPARAMVVGMPNVGKSSLINRLVGRRRAAVGEKPGVTRGPQWVRAGKGVELLDTPGILVPRIPDLRQGIRLAALAMVKDEVVSPTLVAGGILPELWPLVGPALAQRLGLTTLSPEPEENLAVIARAKGLLRAGGQPDLDRAAALLLRELREGRLGRITLERPEEGPPGSGPGSEVAER
ncbi:MAG: ribosome biogenesis GTPase YlqF [Bacillota bacterium]|nr:MAG: ribosome biogenesis GTPase YlqF [Bacillota bacterium]